MPERSLLDLDVRGYKHFVCDGQDQQARRLVISVTRSWANKKLSLESFSKVGSGIVFAVIGPGL